MRQTLIPLLCLALAGCYEVSREVISAALAEKVPYASERGASQDGSIRVFLNRAGPDNDYRFQESRKGRVKGGAFRALRVKGDIYAVQARYDDEPSYYIVFYRILPQEFTRVEVAESEDLQELAGQFGVTLKTDEYGSKLSGAADAMLAFLRAHRDLDFTR
jgi:hypothetical protein